MKLRSISRKGSNIMNATGKLVILSFYKGEHPKTHKPQIEASLSGRDFNMTYVIDRISPIVPEVDANPDNSPLYLCEEKTMIFQKDGVEIWTVIVHGMIGLDGIGGAGYFNISKRGDELQWQCRKDFDLFDGTKMDVILVVDKECEQPKKPGNWDFRMLRPICVGPKFIVMAVELVEMVVAAGRRNFTSRAA